MLSVRPCRRFLQLEPDQDLTVDLQNRVCLITGGASGIGKSTTLALLKAGSHVHVADVSAEAIATLQMECEPELNSRLHCCKADISIRTDVESWVTGVNELQGRIDVLVHCAASVDWKRVDEQTINSIERTMRVGFDGMVYCTKSVLPIMHENGFGRIVYLSSIVSTMHLFPGYAAYAALKAATDAWATMLGIELKGSPIRIANVRPGVVKNTNLFRTSIDRANLPRLFDVLPATTPDRVAAVIVQAVHKSNRTYVTPVIYRLFDLSNRLMPRLSRWMCRWGTSRRTDFTTRDDPPS